MSVPSLLSASGIDQLRNRSFLDLLEGKPVSDEFALMSLAACLGLIPPGCSSWKEVLLCRDPVTNMLDDLLKRMVQAGLLKHTTDTYTPIDLRTACVVDVDRVTPDTPMSGRALDLLDKKLLDPDDLHTGLECGPVYVEERPTGSRWAFPVTLYWKAEKRGDAEFRCTPPTAEESAAIEDTRKRLY